MGKNPFKNRPANKLTIVMLGDGGVGKSSITLKFIKDEFYEFYDPTIDDSYTITVKIDDTPWQIEILDTAGQEEYRGLWVDHAISQGDAFIVTYAVNSTKSFSALPALLNLIANPKSANCGFRHKHDSDTRLVPHPRDYPFPFAIAGNKVDLSGFRAVPTSEAVSLANSTGGLFYECSAKENINIQELFFDLARSVDKLRKAAVVHRQNPTISNRRFIPNIGYQSQYLAQKTTSHQNVQTKPSHSSTHPVSNKEECDRPLSSTSRAYKITRVQTSNAKPQIPDVPFSLSTTDSWKKIAFVDVVDAQVNENQFPKPTKSCGHCLVS